MANLNGYPNVPVNIFNCGVSKYNVFVNETSVTVSVDGTSSEKNWVPQQPESGGDVITVPLNLTTNTTPGAFNLGKNTVTVAPADGQLTPPFTVELPTNVQFNSGQLYLFWDGYSHTPNWAFLNSGEIVVSSTNVVTQSVTVFGQNAVRSAANVASTSKSKK